MKRVFLSILFVFFVITIQAQYSIACFYSSDVPETSLGAAIVNVKFNSGQIDFYDIAGDDSAAIHTAISAITDSSYHKLFLMVDTATAETSDKIQGFLYDTLTVKLFGDTVIYSYQADTLPIYIQPTSTKSKNQVLWDRTDMYYGKNAPLIVKYLGRQFFRKTGGTCSFTSTDSTVYDSTASWTIDAYAGDYVYIKSGTGFGEYRTITSNTSDSLVVSVDFSSDLNTTSVYVVKDDGQSNEIFYDIYSEVYIRTYLGDFTSSTVIANWYKLLDANYNFNDGGLKTPIQDLDYLWNTVIAGGKIIYDYLFEVGTSP